MKNKFVLAIAIIAIVAGAVIAAQAFGGHNSKSAFAGSETVISHEGTSGSTTVDIGEATVKVSQRTDLVIALTAVSNLFTDTTVKGNNAGIAVQESSTAGVKVWAEVTPLDNAGNIAGDPVNAFPGEIILNKRIQTLSGKLSNVISCVDPLTGYYLVDCGYGQEEIELKLDTTSANGFNFLATDLEQGNYLVTVKATLETDLNSDGVIDSPSLPPIAAIGKRTIVVWEVKNPDSVP